MIDYPNKWELGDKIGLARELWGMNNDNTMFVDLLSEELARLDRLNRTETDETILRQRQGACQVLFDLTSMIENARDMHNTLKESEKKM